MTNKNRIRNANPYTYAFNVYFPDMCLYHMNIYWKLSEIAYKECGICMLGGKPVISYGHADRSKYLSTTGIWYPIYLYIMCLLFS